MGRQIKSKPRAKNTKKQLKPMHMNSKNMGKDPTIDPLSIEHTESGNSTHKAIKTVTVDEPNKN